MEDNRCCSRTGHLISLILVAPTSSIIFIPADAMKSFFVNLVVAACALHEGDAFSTLPPSGPSSRTTGTGSRTCLLSASIGSSRNPRSNDSAAKPPRAPTVNEHREMETIRGELVQKYIALGHSEEYAAREVNYFLEDSERSKQYVEMRRIAMARGNDLGIENYVQFIAAFLVGMLGSWVLNSWHAIQVRLFSLCCSDVSIQMSLAFDSADFSLPSVFFRFLAQAAISIGSHKVTKFAAFQESPFVRQVTIFYSFQQTTEEPSTASRGHSTLLFLQILYS